jgi:NADPH:quinone reductase-like Zn-dependent oxidoreductase
VDLVLDGVGGETQTRSFGVLKRGGALISLVQPPSEEAANSHGVRARMIFASPNRALLEHIAARIDEGKLDVRPAVVVPLAEAARAHAMAESGKAHKVVLSVGD